MEKDECYTLMERFKRENCENLHYYLPSIDFPIGLRLISNELDYAKFIAIAYERGVEIPMYVDHFGKTNMYEWLDEEIEEVVDNTKEEVANDIHDDAETCEIGH
ncbi:unnamed protein product [Lactuca saligna]|uniref:Uncharacterized protein n=1 Tax=Lactuca saligna TaxID=75948 RepID=A0AA35Z613_LACSI|nr:unnamed protein product [Lactuca saligna]